MQLTTKGLITQLRQRIVQDAASSARAGVDAKEASQSSATVMEKKQDGRTMIEFGNMARAQALRVQKAQAELSQLDGFASRPLPCFDRRTPIALGAIIEAMGEDSEGEYCRTFVLLPVGAGETLSGPGGDGFVTVITPQSPVGRAMLGKRPGDVAEVTVNREPIEWEILEVC